MPRTISRAGTPAVRGCMLVFVVFWLGGVLFWMGMAFLGGHPQTALCGVPHLLIGLAMLAGWIWPMVVSAKVGEPEIEVSKEPLYPGDPFTFKLRQPVRAEMDVDQVSVRLVFRESATYTQGTTTNTVNEDQVLGEGLQPGRRYQAGSEISFQHPFSNPPGAMHSFSAANNKLQYLLRVHVAIKGWPDFKQDYEIQVEPEGAE